jgi:ABC-2 type transport system permease protein
MGETGSSFRDVLRSELCKLWTVRSTYWSIVAAVGFMLAFAVLEAIFLPGRLSEPSKETLDAVRVSLGGSHLSQIAFGVLGVLVITSEYTSGMIRATFSAVPRRLRVVAAKAIVFSVTSFTIGTTACFAAYFAFQALLSGDSFQSSIGDPGIVRALVGGGLYFAVLGLLGLGIGLIVRASSGAIAALFSLLFIPQILAQLLPDTWKESVGRYVPMQAGSQIFSQSSEAGALSPWAGFAVFCAYAAIALAMGAVLAHRRDA